MLPTLTNQATQTELQRLAGLAAHATKSSSELRGFTFGWTGFTGGGQSYPDGVSIAAGQTKTLMSYFFKEGPVVDGKEARTVTLLLNARMMPEATEKESDRTE
jgi:hypothetical protein